MTYQTGNRSYTTVLGGVQTTYLDSHGDTSLVDNTLVPNNDQGSVTFTNAANDFNVTIPAVMSESQGMVFSRGEFSLELIPQGGDYSRPVARGNAIMFNDVWQGIDVQYTVIGQVIKEDIIVNRLVSLPEVRFMVKVKDTLDLGSEGTGALVAKAAQSRDSVSVGDVVFELSAPAMFDAAGSFSDAVKMVVNGSGLNATVQITASQQWMEDPARVFPVRIDPTVDIAPSAVTLVGVEQRTPDMRIGDNGYPYAGYDDGVTSHNIALYNTFHEMTRTYVGINYDFQSIMREAKIDSATFEIHHYTDWSYGATVFFLQSVDQAWDPATITWNNQLSLTSTYVDQQNANPNTGWLSFNVRDTVNSWVQGTLPADGFVIKAQDERNMQAEVFSNKSSDKPPVFTIDWSIPDPVDPNYPLNDVTVSVRPVTEKSGAGKQIVDGVFADGVAQPDSYLTYILDPTEQGAVQLVDRSYKYPNSSTWDATFPDAYKYADKLSNWQSGLYTTLDNDTTYQFEAQAATSTTASSVVTSDKFLIYQVKATDTLPFIAKWYGVALDTLMRDNHVQDTLAVADNTLFIRNPNTTVPYNPPPLTEEQKKQIDSDLMGRGLHCEYGYEPINLNTGNFWLSALDMSAPDIASDFTLLRSYNSLGQQVQSIFGYGWQFDYSESLAETSDGDLLYSTADGKILTFTQNNDGTYSSPEGFNLTVTAIPYQQDDQTLVRFRMDAADGSNKDYNAWGLLTGVTASNGLTTVLGYDANLNLTSVTSPSGLTLTLGYDSHGRVVSATRPDGVTLKYTYDEQGNLITFTDGNGNDVKYVYDDQHRMTEWWDQEGNRVVANTYDDLGRVIKQIDARDGVSTLVYSQTKTTSTDARGNQTVYLLDEQQRTIGIQYADGASVSRAYGPDNTLVADENGTYSYDARGNMTSQTDLGGRTTAHTYDSQNRMISTTDAAGLTTTYTYDQAGDLLKQDAPGGTDSYTYDTLHRLTSHTNGAGAVETFEYQGTSAEPSTHVDMDGNRWTTAYNPMNQITSVTDPLGGVTRYVYDKMGKQTTLQAPDGGATQYVYNKVSNPVQVIDPNGKATTLTYDPMYNVTTVVDPRGNTTAYTYDLVNNLTSETNPLSATTTYTYDQRNRMASFTAANKGEWTFTYDDRGNTLTSTDAMKATTTYTYDPTFTAPLTITDANGNTTTHTYTPTGDLETLTDPAGNTTTYTYGSDGRLAATVDALGKETHLGYDKAGNVTSIDINGRTTTYSYDPANRLVSSIDAAGNTATYSNDALGRPSSVTDESGRTTVYTYDGNGRIATVTDPVGGVTSAAYDPAGNMLSATDANGNVTAYAYDAMNHLVALTDATGAVTSFTYDAGENMTQVSDPYKNATTYSYDVMGNVSAMTDPLKREMSYARDLLGQITAVTDPAGFTAITTYDPVGQTLTQTLPSKLTTTYSYDKLGNLAKTSTSAGATNTYMFDAASRLVSATNPVGQTARWAYDVWGDVTDQTSADQITTHYQYDKLGNVTSATNDASGTVTYTRDPVGNITSQTDPLGSKTAFEYDQAGRLVSMTDPLGAVTSYAYDPQGNLVSTTDALKGVTAYTYDKLNRVADVTDPNGGTSAYHFDAMSRLQSVTRPAGDMTTYAYDAAGQLATVVDAAGQTTQFGYDPRGLLASITDAKKATTTYAYDEQGNMISQTDPLDRVTRYAYDQIGRMTSLTDPAGGVYSYTYDLADRLTGVKSPLGYQRSFVYDLAGNITSDRDNLGRTNTYAWDGLHNLLSSTDAEGAVSAFVYDALGRMTSATDDQNNSWKYSYDKVSNLISKTDPLGEVNTFAYDLLGRVTSSAQPSGAATTYAYDPMGNLTNLTDPLGHAVSYTYDKNGRVTRQTDGLGQSVTLAWDGMDRLATVTDPADGVATYAYDPVGNLSSVADANGHKTSYEYDAAGQVISAADPTGATTSYTYDKLGDLASVTDPLGRMTSLTWDSESNLTSVENPSGAVSKWTFDPASRVVSTAKPGGVTAKYDYDKVDDLVSVSYASDPDENVAYTYDSLGQRVSMTDMTGTSSYTRDGLGRLTSVTQGDGRTVSYTYAPDGQIASIGYPDESVVKYGYDKAGNLTTVTDSSGASTYAYDDANRVTGLVRPGGMSTDYSYDSRGEVVSLVNADPDGSVLSRYEYTYDDAGLIATESQVLFDGADGWTKVDRVFSYDDADRLASYTQTDPVSVTEPTLSESDTSSALNSVGNAQIEAISETSLPKVTTITYTYDEAGNRVSAMTSLPGDVTLEKIAYTYDKDDRLVSSDSTLSGVTTYTWSESGDLLSASNTDTGQVSYDWTVADRLQAVRSGGRLLMAASYDGDGNLVFQVTARPVAATGIYIATSGSVFTWRDDDFVDSPGGVFWYGFAQQVAQAAAGVGTGLSAPVLDVIHSGWGKVSVPIDSETNLDDQDVSSLEDAGLNPADVSDVVTGINTQFPENKKTTSSVSGFTYDLAHYVNDVNAQYPQILSQYGASDSLTADYTYGLGRLSVSAPSSDSMAWLTGKVAPQQGLSTGWYLPDGRGSVAQVASSSGVIVSQLGLDPWGSAQSSTPGTASPSFGFNAELTDSGVGLQYLRARWYEPTTGRFISQDSTLGSTLDPTSWNRYAYSVGDPLNRVDPSGQWSLWGAVTSAASAVGSAVSSAAHAVASAVTTAAHAVASAVTTAAHAVASAVTTAAHAVVSAVTTAASWVNTNVIQPVVHTVSNAVSTAVHTTVSLAQQAATMVGSAASAAVIAYRSTTAYVSQVTQQAKAELAKFVCTTANKLNDAWESTVQWVKDEASKVDWGMVAGIAAGVIIGGVCMAGTFGIGSIGCAVLAGAVGGAVGGGVGYAQATAGTGNFSWGGLALSAGIGGLAGAAGGFVGAEVGAVVGSNVGSVIGTTAGDIVGGAAGGAASGASSYVVGTVLSGQTPTLSGLGQATAEGGVFGAVGGAAARFGTTEEPTTTAKPVVTEDPTITAKPTPVEEPTGPSACSFTGDTPVLLGDGSTVSISTIGAGQSVTATDPGTGTSSVESVTSVWPHVDRIWDVGLSDGTVIESTANHPWWVASERGFIRTDHLPIGGTVLAASGTTVMIVTVVDTGRTQATYNLTVTGPHTYHIGDDSILVHNCPISAAPATGGTSSLPKSTGWAKPSTLTDHFSRHGQDFGATSASDYASKASTFLENATANNLPVKIDTDGTIRVYDPATNTFGSYTSSGATITFFKPTGGSKYWANQPGV